MVKFINVGRLSRSFPCGTEGAFAQTANLLQGLRNVFALDGVEDVVFRCKEGGFFGKGGKFAREGGGGDWIVKRRIVAFARVQC